MANNFTTIILIAIVGGVGFIGWVLPGDKGDAALPITQSGIQVAACNLFQSGLADNETGPSTSQVIQLTAKSNNILFWITETLADNLTSSGVKIVLYWNNTVLASNFACGTAPTGANAITQNFFYSPTVANLQFTSSLSFEWTQATAGTLYTFFVTVASSTAHAKIVVVGKLGNAVKCSLIGQAI